MGFQCDDRHCGYPVGHTVPVATGCIFPITLGVGFLVKMLIELFKVISIQA